MEFKDVEFMTAKEKELVYKQWRGFVESDFSVVKFTKRLYEHLHLHCGFIAYYDRMGFYYHFFETGDGAIMFINHFTRSHLPHWAYGDYEDINRAMMKVMEREEERLLSVFGSMQMAQDLLRAKILLAKYGMEIKE